MNVDPICPECNTVNDEGLTDVCCAGAGLRALRRIHPWCMYPQVHVMWVLRNLGNVGKTFPPFYMSFVSWPDYGIILIWVLIFVDHICRLDLVWNPSHQTEISMDCFTCHLMKMYKYFFLVIWVLLFFFCIRM